MTAAVAIVGAGIAGLAAAHELQRAGFAVTLFDKGRTAGGRIATRRRDGRQWDHGAVYFTVREPAFANALAPLVADGTIARWPANARTLVDGVFGPDPRPGAERWCGVPSMSALPRALAHGLDVRSGQRIERLARDSGGLLLEVVDLGSEQRRVEGPFAQVLLALPAAQAHALLVASSLADSGPVAARAAALGAALAPCLVAMVEFAEPLLGLPELVFPSDAALGFAVHDGGKPGREPTPTYVLHGTAAWSAEHFDAEPDTNARALVAALQRCLGRTLPTTTACTGHRWRYALAADAGGEPSVHDSALGLGLCGDALVGGRIEGAFTSGRHAALACIAARSGGR